jgi:hypothetical protein
MTETKHDPAVGCPTRTAGLRVNREMDIVPVRLPSGDRAYLDLPRPLTVADATHLCAWIVQYIEGDQVEEARESVNAQLTHNVKLRGCSPGERKTDAQLCNYTASTLTKRSKYHEKP